MATEDLDMGKAWELKKLIRPRRLEIDVSMKENTNQFHENQGISES